MDNFDTSEINQAPTFDNKKKPRKMWALYIVIFLLVGALGAMGWFYYDSNRKVSDQKKLIDNLQQQLRDLGIEAPVDAGAEEGADGTASCDGGSVYAADIGNFEITLSSPNVIIRNLDANFEGGPVTDLSIGQCIAGETNVVDTYLTHKVNILGHPAENSATLRANFEAQWGSPLTAGAPVTIDGVAAQTYTGDGLFATKLVYFDHGGIGYQIELPDANPTSEAVLTDVIADWSFTP